MVLHDYVSADLGLHLLEATLKNAGSRLFEATLKYAPDCDNSDLFGQAHYIHPTCSRSYQS
jgi:hypothetical protein